jgi:hypothetical protein
MAVFIKKRSRGNRSFRSRGRNRPGADLGKPSTMILMTLFSRLTRSISCLFLFFLFSGMSACAGVNGSVHHGFSYGSLELNPNVTIIDFQYGEGVAGRMIRPPRQDVEVGRVAQHTGIVGSFPLESFIYVKWRDNSTGQIHERKVDLKNIIPPDMVDKEIHFDFVNSRLRIFVISMGLARAPHDALCEAPGYEAFHCVNVYTDKFEN